MKTKQILILGGILAALILGILFNQSQRRAEISTQNYVSLDLTFKKEDVAKVTLSKSNAGEQDASTPVELIKNKNGWTVPGLWGARGDQNKIEKFFEEIQKANGEVRGKSKDVFKDFGISEEQGFHVTLSDASGKEMLSFVIGTKKADYGTLFVRKKGSDTVYLTEANLYGQMGLYGDPAKDQVPLDYWPVKNFAFFDQGSINRIEIQEFSNGASKSRLVLNHGAAGWEFEGKELPFAPAPEKISAYLSGLKSNQAQTVVAPEGKDYGFSKPRLKVALGASSGNPYELVVGNAGTKDESVYYVKVTGEPVVFLVSKYYLENIASGAYWFFADNLLQIDGEKIEKLTVHADKIEKTFQPKLKKWDALNSYLESLKNFRIEEAPAAKVKFGKYWIEIKRQGEPSSDVIDFADAPASDKRLYYAQKRGNSTLFAVSETIFRQIFDNLSRLDEPQKA